MWLRKKAAKRRKGPTKRVPGAQRKVGEEMPTKETGKESPGSWTKTREGTVNTHGYVQAVDRHQTERSSQGWAIKCAPPPPRGGSWGPRQGRGCGETETTSRGRRENEDVGPHAYGLPGGFCGG